MAKPGTMNKHVVCLYEESGFSAEEWAVNGYDVFCYDILHTEERVEIAGTGRKIFVPWDATDPAQNDALYARHAGHAAIVLAFPPCTDLAVLGAAWFASKKAANPNYRAEAMALVYVAYNMAEALGCPYAIENPVSVISTQWRKPDHIFDPYEYGGYLPEDDVHPAYPEYIEPRDAYPKKTCYWIGGGFVMPEPRPVPCPPGYSKQHRKLGGKSEKTKRIRSASPRGVAKAIYEAHNGEADQ